jgi:hypothetical protein
MLKEDSIAMSVHLLLDAMSLHAHSQILSAQVMMEKETPNSLSMQIKKVLESLQL